MVKISKLAFWRRGSGSSRVKGIEPNSTGPEKDIAAEIVEHTSILQSRRPSPLSPLSGSKLPLSPCRLPTSIASIEFPRSPSIASVSAPASPDMSMSGTPLASVDEEPPLSDSPRRVEAVPTPLRMAAEPAPPPSQDVLPSGRTAKAPSNGSPSSTTHSSRMVTFSPSASEPSDPVDPAPPPPECVDFSLSAARAWEQAETAFGPAVMDGLKASKWDRRAQALKDIGTVLQQGELRGPAKPGHTGVLGRGLALHEQTRSWRAACQVLHHVLRDKVMPVQLAAHDTLRKAVAAGEGLICNGEFKSALGVLLQHTIERLGDSNLRLHESARRCVHLIAGCSNLGLGAVLERLKAQLNTHAKGADRAKVYFGVLDAVNFLIQQFPAQRGVVEDEEEGHDAQPDAWTQYDVSPFIVPGLCDSLGQRVRDAAVKLAVTVYGTFGLAAMEPMLAGLRPAKQTLLRQKFQESEECDKARQSEPALEMPSRPTTSMSLMSIATPTLGLPGVPEYIEEDCLMDAILEDAGMVFASASLMGQGPQQSLPGMLQAFGMLGIDELEEQFLLEQALLQEFEDAVAQNLSGAVDLQRRVAHGGAMEVY